MGTECANEIVSPLVHGDADRVCIVSPKRVCAECAGCGEVVRNNVHLPLIAYGFYCERCCPCRSFKPSEAEMAAMAGAREGRVARALPSGKVSREESLRRAWAALRAKAQERRAAKEKALTDQ